MNARLQQRILLSHFPRAFASPRLLQAKGAARSRRAWPRSGREFPRRTAQQGAVLLVALVFLILLTLLAIGASSGSLLQQRMVAATRSAQLATMTADAALRGAEWQLWSNTQIVGKGIVCDSGDINNTTGCVRFDAASPLYAPGGEVTLFRTDNNQWQSFAGAQNYKGADGSGYTSRTGLIQATANVADDPQYIIEDLGEVEPPGGGVGGEGGRTGENNNLPGTVNIHIYRITARATGGTQGTIRVVQSTFDAQPGN